MKLNIKTTNAAFEDKSLEAARLLREVAERIESGETEGNLKDTNGNTVGSWKL